MNMKKVAQAFRLLADAFDGAELTEGTLTTADPVGVAGMAEPQPVVDTTTPVVDTTTPVVDTTTPVVDTTTTPVDTIPTPTMTRSEFTTAMQSLGREVGTTKLHAILPAVWETYTNGVARMSAIPADRYAEIVEFTRKEVEKQA